MKKNTRRVLALFLTLALVLGNFTGFGSTVKAATPSFFKVSSDVKTVPAQGGNVEVQVEGENLGPNVYYKISAKIDGMPSTLVAHTSIKCPNSAGGTIQIPVPANEGEAERTITISMTETDNKFSYGTFKVEGIIQAAPGGSAVVDKSKLQAVIAEADSLDASDYTVASWETMQEKLRVAKNVEANPSATEAEVAKAEAELRQAINDLQLTQGQQEESFIQAKVVDAKNQPMKDVAFELIETSASNEKIADLVSDENGEVKYSTKELIAGGQYKLQAPMNDSYFFKPNNGYLMDLDQEGKIAQVDGEPYNGETLVFNAVKIGGETDPEEPAGDTKILKIKVVDENGQPMNNCGFAYVGETYPDSEGMAKMPKEGMLTVKSSDTAFSGEAKGFIKVHKSYRSQFTATPEQIEVTLENGKFATVNGEAYDGTKEYTFTVKAAGGTEEDKAEIIGQPAITPDKFSAEGGTANLTVKGKKLNEELSITVHLNGEPTLIQAVKDVSSTDTLHKYTIVFPKNTTTNVQNYMVVCDLKNGTVLEDAYLPVEVAGKEDSGEDPQNPATITKITATPETLPAGGGSVKLNVEGENLTANNWVAVANGVLEDTTMDRGQVEASNITADGATFNFGKNGIETNRIVWTIQAGTMVDGKFVPQQETVVYQDKNVKVEWVEITEASQPNGQTVVVTFEKDVKVAELKAEELRKLIHFDRVLEVNGKQPESSDYYLQKGDTVTAEGNVVTINLGNILKFTSGVSKVYFDQGALVTTVDGKDITVKEASWVISSKPSVYSIDYEKDVFDYNGGTAVAKLRGVRLEELDLNDPKQFEATISNPQTQEEYDFPMTVKPGEEPTISFDVPKNETESTQSYLLSLKVNGSPVYEATSENKAKRAIVSVLAKDADPSAPTLSSLTISGNNKMEGSTPTDITVDVEKALGQLKIELKLSGTNLDSKLTEARAIDENGVIWPVSHVPE